MGRKNTGIWYSILATKFDPPKGFYPQEKFPNTVLLEENIQIIQTEIANFIQNNPEKLKPYFNKDLVSGPNKWKAFAFKFWTWNINENIPQCPITWKILSNIPGLVSASISILEPGIEILPHRGDTNAICRAHLGLKIPAGLPDCGFECDGEEREWEEGKTLYFNDASKHRAWNRSSERRYVLLYDIILPEYRNKTTTICSMVLAGLIMQLIVQYIPYIKNAPRIIQGLIFYPISFALRPVLLFRRFTGI